MNQPGTAGGAPDFQCPVVHGRPFDPLEPEQVADPFPWLAVAQAETPIFYMDKYDLWCVSRYEDVLTVLKDTATFSSASVIRVLLEPEVARAHPEGHPLDNALVNMDPPTHTRLRRLAQKAFTPKMIAAREPEIRQLCNDLIDTFVEDGRCDLIGQFSEKLPIRAVTQIVGAPLAKASDFQNWQEEGARMSTNAPPLDAALHRELSERAVSFAGWLAGFIEERRREPRDDLTSAMVHAELEDGTAALTTNEVIGLIANILAAGTGTTANFIPLLFRDITRETEQWAAVKADPSIIPKAVEEALRLHNPVRGVRRVVTRDTVLGSVPLRAGSQLYVHYGAPQRDPAIFKDPDAYDLFRDDLNKHFAFGRWAHICLGAPLARLESKVALECLIERLPNVRTVAGQQEHWSPSLLIPNLQEMWIEWEPV
jgi:cytochrome P450